ncbi:MutS protein-like 4 [Papilio machaon]|uniref:MutS protein-like 4 n=1 Tax=Papilio machaon TaxID=76193 RepID=A0A194QYE7_PAPMA|nr:MutS protein-like 4 [Papilio machaon]
MNVVHRDKHSNKIKQRFKNELVRKDASIGIRGDIRILPPNIVPRYQFNTEERTQISKQKQMGPPEGVPRGLRRNSARPDSSSSGQALPRVLASDSGAADTSLDFVTPKGRPAAIRYISSSSKAISEGRGMARGEIGMAAVDLKHPHLVLCQFSDTLLYTHTMTKINYFNPVEIIVPHTFCEGTQPNQLYKLIKDHYPLVNLTTVQRRHFNDAAGRQQIQTLCAPQYSAVCLQVVQKFYALTSAAAVLKYVEYIQCIVFARESLKIEYHSSEDTMIIDVGTATQLELVQPLVPSAGPSCCLLGVLGPTYTVGGIRALRANILQPSCDKEFIEARLDAVQELIENDAGLMVDLQDIIKKLSEIDKILFLCMEPPNFNIEKFGEAQLNQTLLLKTTMEMVPKLVEALRMAESGRLRKVKMDFENSHYNEIYERIRKIIQDDAHLEKGAMGSLQRCFAVRPEINGLLDVARRTYSELIEDIQKVVEQLSESHDLPIRLNQNVMKGFHIVLPVAPKNRRDFNVEDLPDIFIQVHFNGTSVTMTTEELVVLDQQAKESLNEIQKMSNIVISELLKEIRPFMSSLYKLCENVAELDILIALAQTSSIGSYIRPEFNSYLEVRNSVHPLLDYNSQTMPVPNDIFATPEYNFTIITGPNMGGKSIYIKQIAIIQIMAQLGSFVPATNAVLRLCDRIFSRIGFNDSVEFNASTYVIEMKETQHIVAGLTPTSLVIIDELCRGTCSDEGTSLAWAVCEELIKSQAFTFFVTHFLYLTRLQDLYYNVVNRYTVVTEEAINSESTERRLIYQHKIEPGVTTIEHYGLALAAKTNLPEETVNFARELAELITRNQTPKSSFAREKNDDEILYKLQADIRQQRRKDPNNINKVQEIVSTFKTNNPELIKRIQIEKNKINNSVNPVFNTSSDSSLNNEQAVIEYSKKQEMYSFKDMKSSNRNESNVSELYTNTQNDNYNDNGSNSRHVSVKSSTELLHTVSDSKLSNDFQNEHIFQDLSHTIDTSTEIHINCSPNFNRLGMNDDFNESVVSNTNINSKNSSYADYNAGEEMEICDEIILNDKSNESTATANDTVEADALTQIIGEYAGSSSSSENFDATSTDEELMQETIKEINLNGNDNLETIILTPPAGFRDGDC